MKVPFSPARNLLQKTVEVRGDLVTYRFGNGLVVRTETLGKRDPLRILPLGGPQSTLMNYMLNAPERIQGRRVLEPFAGSGVLGLMALKVGAAAADFVDLNPRAGDFQRENARLNGFGLERFRSYVEGIETFQADCGYDLLFANPPFVPTPEGIAGTLTSNGGPEGNRLAAILLSRLDDLLAPSGEAFLYVFQMMKDGKPLVLDLAQELVTSRSIEASPTQAEPIAFPVFVDAYLEVFPGQKDAIRAWAAALTGRCGEGIGLMHYVVHVGPRRAGPTACRVVDNLEEKYGEGFLSRYDAREFAIARISENLLAVP